MQAATVEHTQHFTSPGPTRSAAPITRGTRYRSPLLWCAAGFFAGVLFWHAVGFWRFVSDVVLDSGPQLAPTKRAAAQPSRTSLPTIYLVDPGHCTLLVLDRKTNSTEMRPCPQQELALRLEPDGERESLAAVGSAPGEAPN